MAAKFYSTIIEEEKKAFKIENKSLSAAAKSIAAYHSIISLGKRQSFQPSAVYYKPPNRCVYLYRYATINSGLVTKYFRKLAFKKEVKNSLFFKKEVKVCCLGGGPGTDVFGVFRALAVSPSLHGKITEVSVLDICSGWENMFNNVISGLLDEKVKDIPATFVNQNKFTHKFITVNLLDYLPQNVKEIISNADIVCMTRFVSELFGDERSSNSLKVLGNLIKLEALVLCIDIVNEKVFELSEDIFKDNGFETVLGPLHEKFFRGSTSERKVYGYNPQVSANFCIVGWRKTSVTLITNTVFDERYLITNNSDTQSEVSSSALEVFDSEDNSTALEMFDSEDNSTALDRFDSEDESLNEPLHSLCHTYTQTELDFLPPTVSSEREDLLALMKAVSNLINVSEQWKQKFAHSKCCCCNHQHQSC